jgi:hypothetical protein
MIHEREADPGYQFAVAARNRAKLTQNASIFPQRNFDECSSGTFGETMSAVRSIAVSRGLAVCGAADSSAACGSGVELLPSGHERADFPFVPMS